MKKIGLAVLGLLLCQAQAWAGLHFKDNLMNFKAPVGERFVVDLRTLVEGSKGKLEWSAGKGIPSWLTVDTQLEMMFGIPALADVGGSQFMLAVREGEQGALGQIKIEVPGPKPEHLVFKKKVFTERILIGSSSLKLDTLVDGVDTEKGQVFWSLSADAPKWTWIEEGVLKIDAGEEALGVHEFQIFATHDGVGAVATLRLDVVEKLENRPPVWVSKAVNLPAVCVGQTVRVDLNQFVVDPDGDKLTFTNATRNRETTMPQVTVSESGILTIQTVPTTWLSGYRADIAANDGQLTAIGRMFFTVKSCVW